MDLSKYNIDKFIEDTDSMTMNNIRFDELDVNSLIVNEENLLDALSKQAAAVAYFGALYKRTKNMYEDMKKQCEYQYNIYYQSASNYLSKDKTSKNTIKDIEAMTYAKYSKEINEWNEKLQKARDMADMFESYYEAWKQKSFVLNNMTQMAITGLLTPKGSIVDPDSIDNPKNKMTNLIKRMRENNQ